MEVYAAINKLAPLNSPFSFIQNGLDIQKNQYKVLNIF
jgi:hypothetical protein